MSRSDAGRVAYVVKRYPRFSETFIVNEILAHEAAGLDLEVVALKDPREPVVQDVVGRVRAPVHYLPMPEGSLPPGTREDLLAAVAGEFPGADGEALLAQGTLRDFHYGVSLARLVRLRGIGHLHAHFASSATTVARVAAILTGVPYSFTAHAKDIFHESVDPADLERKLRDASGTVTVSDFNLDYLRRHHGPAAARVRRVYNGLDLQEFGYGTPRFREPRILFVGRFVAKKGVEVLLDACAQLAGRGVQFRCDLVGAGPLEAALRDRAAALHLGSRVAFLGPQPRALVQAFLQRAAVFAAPCVVSDDGDRDGLPTVLLEAMALGTPCIATDVTGIPEVLRDGVTGVLVPQHDAAALATAIARVLAGPALRARLAEAARRQMVARFDVHRNAAELRELFTAARPVEVA